MFWAFISNFSAIDNFCSLILAQLVFITSHFILFVIIDFGIYIRYKIKNFDQRPTLAVSKSETSKVNCYKAIFISNVDKLSLWHRKTQLAGKRLQTLFHSVRVGSPPRNTYVTKTRCVINILHFVDFQVHPYFTSLGLWSSNNVQSRRNWWVCKATEACKEQEKY